MILPLLSILGFSAVCFLLGLPLAQFLLKGAGRRERLMLSAILGLAALVMLTEPFVRLAGTLRLLAPIVWALALLSLARAVTALARTPSSVGREEARRMGIAALGFAAFYVALVALPWEGGIPYALFRTNPSDAHVNVAFADLWGKAPWRVISSYAQAWRTPGEAQATTALLNESPIGVFSARFVRFEVRHATGLMMGLQGAMFSLPCNLTYLPFQLAAVLIASGGVFGMLRAAGAARWISFVACLSLLGGWSYIIRESDNSNQVTAMPLMIGALYIALLRFDGPSPPGWRGAAVLALVLAAAVTSYPEVGLMFGAALGASLILRGLVKRAGRSHWVDVATVAGIAGIMLLLNGQVGAVLRWHALLGTEAFNLQDLTGPTSNFLLRDGYSGFLGIGRSFVSPGIGQMLFWIFVPVTFWVAAALVWGGLRSHVGLAMALYALLMAGISLNARLHASYYVMGRSASFLGMVFVAGCGLSLFAGSRPPAGSPARRRFDWRMIGAVMLTAWTAATLPLWLWSFKRPKAGYSSLALRSPQVSMPPVPHIEAALAGVGRGRLALYIPPAPDQSVPWFAHFHLHLLAAEKDAAFLSGFMYDNDDTRVPGQGGFYEQPAWRDRAVDRLLVSTLTDPVPSRVQGELTASDGLFRLYAIAPIPLRELSERLKKN